MYGTLCPIESNERKFVLVFSGFIWKKGGFIKKKVLSRKKTTLDNGEKFQTFKHTKWENKCLSQHYDIT